VCTTVAKIVNNISAFGLVVNSKMKHSVIDLKPTNHRRCTLRVRGRFNNLSLICAHAPTEQKNEYIKDSFYEELKSLLSAAQRIILIFFLETLMLR
jgi:hypothetical protein